MTDKLYRMKELEWVSVPDSVVHISITTPTNSWGGYYHIFQRTPNDKLTVRFNNGKFSDYKTLESAKLACQSHYEERIKQSLKEVDVLDRVKEVLVPFADMKRTNSAFYWGSDVGKERLAQQILTILDQQENMK